MTTARSARRATLATGLAVLALPAMLVTLAGCQLPGLTGGDDPPDPSTTTDEPTADTSTERSTERPTELPTDLRECPPVQDADETVPLAGWDVTAPAGFVEVDPDRYGQFAPIEGENETRFFDLEGVGFPEVLGLAYYPQLEQGPVTDRCGRLDHEAVLERIALQLADSDETAAADPVRTEVAGAPAYEVLGEHASGYLIRNVFVYGEGELLHVECQWVAHEQQIAAGCDALLASLIW